MLIKQNREFPEGFGARAKLWSAFSSKMGATGERRRWSWWSGVAGNFSRKVFGEGRAIGQPEKEPGNWVLGRGVLGIGKES